MMVAERTAARLEAYENRTSLLMVLLALAYLLVFAVQVLVVPLPPTTEAALEMVGFIVWVTFAIDLAIRTYLAPGRWQFLVSHPIDVLAVAVPAFRILRVLRVITAGQWLVQRGSRLAISRTALAIFLSVGFLAVVGALAVLDAERGAPGSNIENFGDAMWWAFVTMSTVGYGDTFPVTAVGQLVAVGMMLVGISLLGVVSGTLASGLVARLQGEQEDDLQLILEKMDGLEAQVTTLTKALQAAESRSSSGR